MRNIILALSIATAVQAQPAKTPCSISAVDQLSSNELRLDTRCDISATNFTFRNARVIGGGETIPALLLGGTDESTDPGSGQKLYGAFHLRLEREMKPDIAYKLHIDELSDDVSEVKDGKSDVITKGTLAIRRFTPQEIFASFPATVTTATVKVTRAGQPLQVSTERVQRTGERALLIHLNKPLLHGDNIVVTATTTANASITASIDKLDFAKPADRKAAAFYLSLNTEAGQYQKPNVTLDWKAERRRPLGLWTHAPKADVIVATQDANGTNKATLGWNFEYLQLFRSGYVIGILYDITPSAELEKGLVNRNWMTDASATIVFPTTKHFTFRPTLGVEIGRNFGLKKDYRQFEDFDIRRIKGNAYLAWAWDLPARVDPGVQRVTFSIDATIRHLEAEEINSTPIPPSERTDPKVTATYALDDDQRFYGTATLDVKLAEYFGIALEYAHGERPLLFEDNNKVTLKWTFMF